MGVTAMHAPPCAWYPASHSSRQLPAWPWLPLPAWWACALGVEHATHCPAALCPQPKRYWPVPQSLAHGLHEFVSGT